MELGKNFSEFTIDIKSPYFKEYMSMPWGTPIHTYFGVEVRVDSKIVGEVVDNQMKLRTITTARIISNDANTCIRPLDYLKIRR